MTYLSLALASSSTSSREDSYKLQDQNQDRDTHDSRPVLLDSTQQTHDRTELWPASSASSPHRLPVVQSASVVQSALSLKLLLVLAPLGSL